MRKKRGVVAPGNLLGDDLDEPELMDALDAVVLTGNRLDNELQSKFGGKLFGPDK